jgi:tetratricopeptide (TPR) repeat protein
MQLAQRPDDPEAIVWVGRRLAYLGRYGEAIETFSRGIESHPDDPRLYRHRGHRYITVRRLDAAVADLERAAQLIAGTADEIEPDGLPNARNIPTSTLHTNVWYHLGLAFYLRHDFERALDAYQSCLAASRNPDLRVAASHWLYMTLRRLGRDGAEILEPIHAGLDVIENQAYHELLLAYRGEKDPEALLEESRGQGAGSLATTGYGIGNWFLYDGRRERALRIFREIVATDAWASFGYIAAESELAHLE